MACAQYGVAFTIGSRRAAHVAEISSPGNLQARKRLLTCPWVRQLGVVMGRFAVWKLGAALGAAAIAAQPALADQVVADDLIIEGSVCAGINCSDGEAFGTGTARLKTSTVRLDFVDTSSGGFPTRDWRLEANGFGSGEGDHFAIKDMGDTSTGAEAGTAIVKVMAGAPANSLFVDLNGRLGLSTATPARDLHIFSNILPSIRLEQSAVNFPARTWDIVADDLGFTVRDETGETSPLIVNPSAPSNSLRIGIGRIGMRTSSPEAPLDIRANGINVGTGNSVLRLVNTDGPTAFQLHPFGSSFFWNFAAADNNTFRINRSGNGTTEMELNGSGNLTISGTIKTAGPTCASGCDAVFDAGYDLPSIEEHAEAMWAKKHLPIVGPTLPNEPVDLSERYGLMLNELETAHIYIEQLHREKAELRAELEAQRADLKTQQEANDERFARLETALSTRLD
jgi:hypothetical protein